MRLRRGNYAILFVLTCAVMMSYLAFSIDGGRMKVAYIQSENAAEAAALAAMAVIRDGGSAGEAQAAAATAAQAVRLQRLEGRKEDEDFEVSMSWGGWNWQEQGTFPDLGFRWHPESADDRQAVTINVAASGGVKSIFGPAIGLVARPDGDFSDGQSPADKAKYERFEVQVGARAAFRHRDTLVLVDVSKQNERNLPQVRDAVGQLFDTMDDFNVPGDRVGLMGFAGDTWVYDLDDVDQGMLDPAAMLEDAFAGGGEPTNPFYVLADTADTAAQVAQIMEPCYVGPDAWFNWYRYMKAEDDAELVYYPDFLASFEYWVVGPPSDSGNVLDRFRLDPTEPNNAFMLQYMDLWATANVATCDLNYQNGTVCPYFTNLAQSSNPLDKGTQCLAWLASETVFTGFDPRRASVLATGRRSPLDCHDGNFFEGRADAIWTDSRPVLAQNCAFLGDQGFDGVPRYGAVDGEELHPNQSYTTAGSWPGRALDRALDEFGERLATSAEANIVLITASPPNCGPLIGATWGGTCTAQVTDEALAAVEAIQATGDINLYVIAISSADPDETAFLNASLAPWDGIGRGWYSLVSRDQLGSELVDIARDLKIQVVQ